MPNVRGMSGVLVVLVVLKGRPVGSAGRVRLWAERPGRPLRSGRRRTAVSRGVSALP
ncbi:MULTISPECIES: hypothetical protein [Streptomyces]|uniref:hypothetical protein n=1 Tax=Streptomyces TaxID=1883 RepID=UPI00131D1ACC|nr:MULTISPECIES: hypothetical protein [Streptomyces]MCC0580148.1 hypothetical protein [Streptomyces californicus]MYW80612.1 hypothetical protein [Streptomyces sp. SID8369]